MMILITNYYKYAIWNNTNRYNNFAVKFEFSGNLWNNSKDLRGWIIYTRNPLHFGSCGKLIVHLCIWFGRQGCSLHVVPRICFVKWAQSFLVVNTAASVYGIYRQKNLLWNTVNEIYFWFILYLDLHFFIQWRSL